MPLEKERSYRSGPVGQIGDPDSGTKVSAAGRTQLARGNEIEIARSSRRKGQQRAQDAERADHIGKKQMPMRVSSVITRPIRKLCGRNASATL